jgi:HK97 family phage major capsid protein
VSAQLERLKREVRALFAQADNAGRETTITERRIIGEKLDQIETLKQIEFVSGSGGYRGGGGGGSGHSGMGDSLGERFVRSASFRKYQDPSARRVDGWATDSVDVGWGYGMKGTLLEGSGAPGSGTGGGLMLAPQVVDGAVLKLFQPLRIEDLLMSGVAESNTVRYGVEGTALSAAAGVAEGGTKPESTLAYSAVDEKVKKVATTLTLSDELMDDAPSVTQLVNGRLTMFINIEVERQLCRGTSGGDEVQGLLTSRGIPVYTGGTADNKAIQMFKAMNSMRGSAFLEPEWSVVHPTDYQIMRLLTDTTGQLLGGGPWQGQYGGAALTSTSPQVTGNIDTLWGKPCIVTTALGGPGTALIGTRSAAQVWSKGGLNITASNSHASYFQQDLVMMRGERRMALTLYRAGGFVETRLAVGPGG